MKLVRVYTGDDAESHLEELPLEFRERGRTEAILSDGVALSFAERTAGDFADFHNGPERQYVFYLTCTVEIACGDGSTVQLGDGDVLFEEDDSGRGHSTRVLESGVCAFARLTP